MLGGCTTLFSGLASVLVPQFSHVFLTFVKFLKVKTTKPPCLLKSSAVIPEAMNKHDYCLGKLSFVTQE